MFSLTDLSDHVPLTISIVSFRPDIPTLQATLDSLSRALDAIPIQLENEPGRSRAKLFLVDNDSAPNSLELEDVRARAGLATQIISGHGNVGYGRGHNLAIALAESRFHLILNPDVEIAPDALARGLAFMDANPEVGLVTPYVSDADGAMQYLCRRFPRPHDLFIRGFLPARLQRYFANSLARYEMRDVINDHDVVWDPPIVSGCFMLFRTSVLKRLAGFDPRYFLYFEDYDLSLRTHEVARVVYLPTARIVHHGGGASRKGWLHVRLFVTSMFKFFNRFGWKWL